MTGASFGRLTDPLASLVIGGARVIDPASGTDEVRDLAISGGMLVDVAPADAERIDGAGLVVAPGLCDLHVHLRQPGGDGAESIASGARAAARGGYTTICAMPNTTPAIDSAAAVSAVLGLAAGAACRVRVIGAASRERAGLHPSDAAEMASAGAIGVSDDGQALPDGLVGPVLDRLARLGLPLFEHPDDGSSTDGVMRAGATATRLGLAGWSPAAELATVERDLAAAAAAGARLHLTHLSSPASVEAVRRARARGQAVTCDVTPHHLAMADDWVAGSRRFAWHDEPATDPGLAYDGSCRVNPPLASRADALALLGAVADGTVDAIATDHAPHLTGHKAVPFEAAAPGLVGLETALSLGLEAVAAGRLDLTTLLAAMSTRPAALIGERRGLASGMAADLVAFDPELTWRVEPEALASASSNTPLLSMRLRGVVRLTVAGGRVTYRSIDARSARGADMGP